MSGMYGFSREAIRVKVKKCEGVLQPEFRKFSVDPQITSFEVLQSILAKAFDIKGDFTICYRLYDVYGHETYMPLLSDWELDAAFLKAYNTSVSCSTEPCLCLRVDLKPFEECADDWDIPANVPVITQIRTGNAQEAKPSPRLPGLIMNHVERTFNMVQRALNLSDENNIPLQPPRPPLSDSEFRKFLDPVGQIVHSRDLRSAIYFGGIDPSLRKVVWKHILNVYPEGMSGRERMDYIRKKASEYINLRETWRNAVARGPVVGELAYTTGMVRKDVLRTDRHHRFYAGSDDNQNIASLFNILTTYALNHPKVSYCQGMSDLASPLLVTMGDEAHAYICFCALMKRLSTNFMLDGIAMTQKFTHLAEGLLYYDTEFYNYLKSYQADDLLFCYRWLLLEMKREFAFDDSLRMLEVLWSSLPSLPPEKELKLYDVHFQPPNDATPPISPLVKTPRENAYTKVCALRRQSSSISLASYSGTNKVAIVKRQNHSLDETTTSSKSVNITDVKHQSLDDTTLVTMSNNITLKGDNNGDLRPRSVSPFEPKSDSIVLNNRVKNHMLLGKSKSSSLSSSMSNLIKNNSKKTGHFRDLKERLGAKNIFSSLDKLDTSRSIREETEINLDKNKHPSGRVVKNFNEFLNFASVNKNKISDRSSKFSNSVDSNGDKPLITLTKSSFDDSESSSVDFRHQTLSSKSDSCDDTFDGSSPDDSQEYFPMTTSITRELRLELENLDRQVFGKNLNQPLLDPDSPGSDCSVDNSKARYDCLDGENSETITEMEENETNAKPSCLRLKNKNDDVFVWENPLHQTSPGVAVTKTIQNYLPTPDEQADLEYDNECIDAINSSTKLISHKSPSKKPPRTVQSERSKSLSNEPKLFKPDSQLVQDVKNSIPPMVNSCEELTEAVVNKNNSKLLPPPQEFGGGNPFLMFLCITVLLQHRDIIIRSRMDYNEMAMHFDKMVRKHNVTKVLNQARQLYAGYIKQHTLAQQNFHAGHSDA